MEAEGILEDPEKAQQQPEAPVRTIFGIKWILVILSLLSVTFLFSLDSTIVAAIQPQIVERFGEPDKLRMLYILWSPLHLRTSSIIG